MKNYLKYYFFYCLLIALFNGCVDNDFSPIEVACSEVTIQSNITILQLKSMYTFGSPILIEDDLIVEGFVISSDEEGNFYKSISIQDKPENPTAGIKIAIDETDLYTKYNIGRKLLINLKGLALGYSYGSLQIGKVNNNTITGISTFELDKYVIRTCETAELVPKKVLVSELNRNFADMLVELEGVQFSSLDSNKTFANTSTTETIDRMLFQVTENCNLIGEIPLRTSGYSNFKNQLLPQGKGTVIAVCGNYYNEVQLYINNTSNILFTEQMCTINSNTTPTISLKEVIEMYQDEMIEFGVLEEYIVEAYVISSDVSGNFNQKLVVQDSPNNPTAGVQLYIEKENYSELFSIGDKIIISLNQLYMQHMDDILTIGFPSGDKLKPIEEEKIENFITNTFQNFQVIPQEIEILETKNSQIRNTLITLVNVQLSSDEVGKAFTTFTGENDGLRTIETCGEQEKVQVFTSKDALFATSIFPIGKGSITGILNSSIKIRDLNDIQFNEPFEPCPIIIPKIMITEVADPSNNVSDRFIELFNAGETPISLVGWKLNKYINGATSVSSGSIDLSEITMQPGEFAIISNSDFPITFGVTPTITSSYISGNGDDVYELVDNAGNTIDIFGVIGEDGNGTTWEYLDGKAIRKLEYSEPNPIFNKDEWIIYSAAANPLISFPNSPQESPLNFNPFNRN